MSISRYPNPTVTWEKGKKLDLGIKIRTLNNLTVKVDYFRQHRFNILMKRNSIPVAIGLSATPKSNVGAADNHGLEGALTYRQFFGKNIFLKVRANFTFARSKYTKYSEPSFKDTPWKLRVGHSIKQPYGFIAERLFIDSSDVANAPVQFGNYAAGDIKYRDVNGDGKITGLDQVPIGYPTIPEINYGFGFSFGYKDFDLSIFFEGLAHESFFIDANATAPFVGNHQLLKVYADNHWSSDNQDIYAIWPRFSDASNLGNDNNFKQSTWWQRNGTFLRVKLLEIGYSLPVSIANAIHLHNCRFYLDAADLFTLSHFHLWDPEMAGNGLAYPIQKKYSIGVKVKF
jgi:TonB-linked SusC/RagA family outer membrane protein